MNEIQYSFQVDDEIVKRQREENDNYIVEYNKGAPDQNLCVLYFSSHDIYYPNDAVAFEYSILRKNRFEWRNCRVESAGKHIYLRDVNKQWYLSGINSKISNPNKLLQFLKQQTNGYKVITIGSSAGGYAAVLYGMLLDNVVKVYAFSPRFTMHPLLNSSPIKNPLYHRLKDIPEYQQFLDLKPLLLSDKSERVFYFVGEGSKLDMIQINHLGEDTHIQLIKFSTIRHGIPFPKVALPRLFEMDNSELKKYSGHTFNPIFFSMRIVGIYPTVYGIFKQFTKLVKKKIKRLR